MEKLKESSLTRIWQWNEKFDCGALTAFRNASDCGNGEVYVKADNSARNKSLLAKLKSAGYSVTTLKGTYPEGGTVGKETSFFVADQADGGKLEADLKKFGEEFEQGSVLFVPKGAIKGESKAYLIGTNRCENNWLGYHKTEIFAKGKLGYSSEIYTSKVNGRPFIFEDIQSEVKDPGNGFGFWMMNRVAQKDWKELL